MPTASSDPTGSTVDGSRAADGADLDGRPSPAPGRREVDDEVLARRAGLGDRQAFAALVDRHGGALHRFAARMLDDRSETADCLQDAFTDAWRGLPDFRAQASVRTWLFTLTAHAVRRYQRRHLARTARPVDQEDLQDLPATTSGAGDHADPASLVEMNEFVAALDAALDQLPVGQRAAWLLREVEGLSYADIARITGVPADTVRGRLARARTNLEVSMEAWR